MVRESKKKNMNRDYHVSYDNSNEAPDYCKLLPWAPSGHYKWYCCLGPGEIGLK